METLKSKWEKFFRTAGIKYIVTSDLAKTADDYMPDFHLPDLDTFVDIRRVGEYSFTDLDTTGDNDMTQVACGEAPWAEYPVERFIEAASFSILSFPNSFSTSFSPNSVAHPAPLPVIRFPSSTTGSVRYS